MSTADEHHGTVGTVFRNRELRLLEIAWAGSVIGHYGFQIALGVYAYQEGGAAARLRVDAEYVDGRWKIAGMSPA